MGIGYARVSTDKLDLSRQLDALATSGLAVERIRVDKKPGATTNPLGLQAAWAQLREGPSRGRYQ